MDDKKKKLIRQIQDETGYETYDDDRYSSAYTSQFCFYGTSDMWDKFVNLIGDNFPTGTMAYIMDTRESKLYSSWTKQWY